MHSNFEEKLGFHSESVQGTILQGGIYMAKQNAIIYVDGSYNRTTTKIGCGIVLFLETNKRPHRIAYSKKLKSQIKYGSNIAEITAVKTAIKTALSLGATRIYIYHDWMGVEYFSHFYNIKKRHEACPFYEAYAKYVEQARNNTRIRFIKVKAHSGNEYNVIADKMAKIGKAV